MGNNHTPFVMFFICNNPTLQNVYMGNNHTPFVMFFICNNPTLQNVSWVIITQPQRAEGPMVSLVLGNTLWVCGVILPNVLKGQK
ncbi:hypothetical protein CIK97_03370 [Prevotella sp. P3-120]|nr:hypothetical protein CIK97_03370 [Prevotella sp. P3-120]OYP51731.1 hypothetical protein CIK93_04590 [Prevotella sp. P3-92]